MKTIINENQRGLLFKNGQFIKVLTPGVYRTFKNKTIDILSIEDNISSPYASLDVLLKDKTLQSETIRVQVKDEQLALRFVNDQFVEVLQTGDYAFFNYKNNHFIITDISQPYVDEKISQYIFNKIPKELFKKVEVPEYHKCHLSIDQQFVKLLESGTYYFWNNNHYIQTYLIDTRLLELYISGQEILTADKVTLRLNFIANYKITDYMKIFSEVDDYLKQLRTVTSLILREYIGKYKLDEILENKEKISLELTEKLKEKAKDLYLEIYDAGIKDIILPGDIRNIMNTVLIASKQAQANVITRREEVASTRSLLNTAKLMDENKTLYKLKELEYIERICKNVGEISVGNQSNILTELTKMLGGD